MQCSWLVCDSAGLNNDCRTEGRPFVNTLLAAWLPYGSVIRAKASQVPAPRGPIPYVDGDEGVARAGNPREAEHGS